ncbi:MAG: glycosyltransferase family 2 protein [Pseudomonadota bacterium]
MTPKVVALATVRDEAPYIVDWLGWLSAIGIEHAVVYENDSTDGTGRLLAALAATGRVTYVPNGAGVPMAAELRDLPPQRRAYARATRNPRVQGADWIFVHDVDELLELPWDGTVQGMIARLGEPDVVSMPWRNMAGGDDRGPAPVWDRFPWATAPDAPSPVRSLRQVKSIFRPGVSRFYNLHKPRAFREGVRWVCPNGEDIRARLRRTNTLEPFDYARANLRHYHLRSPPEFAVKVVKGFACTDLATRGQLGMAMYDAWDLDDNFLPAGATAAQAADHAAALRSHPAVAAAERDARARHRHLQDLAAAAVASCEALHEVTLRYRLAPQVALHFETEVWQPMRLLD